MFETCIAKILHGSHLYGTATADSDVDVKSVWLPAPVDIVLGRTGRTESNNDSSRTNNGSDVDHEASDLLRFVDLLSSSHPAAIECLFAPASCHLVDPSPAWVHLLTVQHSVAAASVGAFVGYAEAQAPAFGLFSERASAAKSALAEIRILLRQARTVADLAPAVVEACASPHVSIVQKDGETFLQICGRHQHFGARAQAAEKTVRTYVESFGERMRKAESEDIRDWRAVSHAIRIAEQGAEFMRSGAMAFPRPNAEELTAVKQGRMPRAYVAERLHQAMADLNAAARESVVPAVADRSVAETLVALHYAEAVRSSDLKLSWDCPTVMERH